MKMQSLFAFWISISCWQLLCQTCHSETCQKRDGVDGLHLTKPPNLLILLADDLGYGDLASYGNPSQEWGGIDDLVSEGLRFTQVYSADSMCSPSRAALLTGRLPIRTGIVSGPMSQANSGRPAGRVFFPSDTGGLPKEEIIIPEILKTNGYRTGMVGKWHLGINENTSSDGAHLPHNHGFDFVGINLPMTMLWDCDETGVFMKDGPDPKLCFLYDGPTIIQQPLDHTNLTQKLVDGFVRFLDHQPASQPFFFYFSFPQVHTDLFSSPQFKGKSRRGMFGDNLNELHWAVGKVVDELKRRQLDQDTLTIFLSDHGPHRELCLAGGVAGGLTGGKATTFEGGFRIPFVARWPGVISQGKATDTLLSAMDLFPSFLALINVSLPADRYYDGVVQVEELLGRCTSRTVDDGTLATLLAQSPSPRAFFFYCNQRLMAVRFGRFKLHYFTVPVFQSMMVGNSTAADYWCPNGWPLIDLFIADGMCADGDVIPHDPPLIYNLNDDPQEQYKVLINDTYRQLILKVDEIVREHKATLINRRPPQIGHKNETVNPCCNPPLCRCHETNLGSSLWYRRQLYVLVILLLLVDVSMH